MSGGTPSSEFMTMTDRHMILFDRDGTLNVRRPSHVADPADLELLPGAAEAVARSGAMARVVVVTNQQSVGRGDITGEQLAVVHDALQARLAERGGHLDAIYVCPHLADTCVCRKPADGLFRQALADAPDITPDRCIMIGDQPSDLTPALALGMAAFHVVGGPDHGETPEGAVRVEHALEAVERVAALLGRCT